jgi:hypothetical protein
LTDGKNRDWGAIGTGNSQPCSEQAPTHIHFFLFFFFFFFFFLFLFFWLLLLLLFYPSGMHAIAKAVTSCGSTTLAPAPWSTAPTAVWPTLATTSCVFRTASRHSRPTSNGTLSNEVKGEKRKEREREKRREEKAKQRGMVDVVCVWWGTSLDYRPDGMHLFRNGLILIRWLREWIENYVKPELRASAWKTPLTHHSYNQSNKGSKTIKIA